MLIKDMTKYDMPRERMIENGASVLSDYELLAILLRTGSAKDNVLELSQRIISMTDGFVKNTTIEKLQEIHGVGSSKACQVIAILELVKRIKIRKIVDEKIIRNASDLAEKYFEIYEGEKQEKLICVFLDTRLKVIAEEVIFIGTVNCSIIHPRDIFSRALEKNAVNLILIHNHPSGDPTPSQDDIDVTNTLVECGRIMNIKVIDHIIIGDNKYFSMKEKEII